MVKSNYLYNNFNIKSQHKRSIILIGNFDGLHLGHQKLFTLAKKYKKKYSLKLGVLTFEPMPKMFFNRYIKNFRISNKYQKINLLNNLNVDFVIIKKFSRAFSKTIAIDPAHNSLVLPLSTIKSGFVQIIFFFKFFSNKFL